MARTSRTLSACEREALCSFFSGRAAASAVPRLLHGAAVDTFSAQKCTRMPVVEGGAAEEGAEPAKAPKLGSLATGPSHAPIERLKSREGRVDGGEEIVLSIRFMLDVIHRLHRTVRSIEGLSTLNVTELHYCQLRRRRARNSYTFRACQCPKRESD